MEAKNTSKSSEIKVKDRKSTKTAPKDPVLEELKQLYSNLTPEKKIICYSMLEEAAFLKNTLEGLRKEIKENGTTDEYKNGANQYGKKISASLQSYNNTLKNYYALIEKIVKMFPLESGETDELLEFLNS